MDNDDLMDSLTLNRFTKSKVNDFIKSCKMKIGELLVQITPDNSNGNWEPIKSVLNDKRAASCKGVLLIVRIWVHNIQDKYSECYLISNWNENQFDQLGFTRIVEGDADSDANRVETDKERFGLHFNNPGVLVIEGLCSGGSFTIYNDGTNDNNCTAVEVCELL